MKILVTGKNGQLGQELQQLAQKHTAEFVFTSKEELDITNRDTVLDFLKKHAFDYCINCAAYTSVDKAEEETNTAEAANVKGVRNIADACKNANTTLIHLSSDYVYHNEVNRPMMEIDPTTPKSVYAQTKLNGDFAAMTHSESVVIRTSWVYSSFGNNFVKTMLKLGVQKEKLKVVCDQIGTPTYAHDIAVAILHIIKECETGNAHFGTFNFSNEGVTSWYDFAKEIFNIKGLSCDVQPILSKEYPTAAKRPHYSVLNKSKIKTKYNMNIPHWRDSLKKCLNKM